VVGTVKKLGLVASPEGGDEEAEDDHDFESAEDHEEGEKQFGQWGEEEVVFGGADHVESWADVVEGGGDGGEGGFEVELSFGADLGFVVEDHEQDGGEEEDDEDEADVGADASSEVVVEDFAADFEGADDAGSEHAFAFEQGDADEEHDANDFDAAAGGAGGAADEHEDDEEPS